MRNLYILALVAVMSVYVNAALSQTTSNSRTDMSKLSDDELKQKLSPQQYYVTKQDGTEPAVQKCLLGQSPTRDLCRCDLWRASFHFEGQVRLRDWLAKFYQADRFERRDREDRCFSGYGQDRGPRCQERRSSRTCLRRWSEANRTPVLYELCRAPIHSRRQTRGRRLWRLCQAFQIRRKL